MKIPIFEEIVFKNLEPENLHKLLFESRIGKVPCYLNLSTLGLNDLKTLLTNLEQILLEKSIHPRFPYPFYIITPTPVGGLFPQVRAVKDLPEHYFKKIKRPNNKDLQLLNKISLKIDKINNLELYRIANDFKDTARPQKKLYQETKELHFLEFLNFVLFENPKLKNKKDRN